MLPLMLDDFHKVLTSARGEAEPFSKADVRAALRRAVVLDLNASTEVAPGLVLTPHYAGHVLGAAMFEARARGASVVYTGDYNTAADRHLGPARLPRLRPDLLITESTYATTVRGPKRAREAEFVAAVVAALARGGRVLVPVFALGRAQELMCLLDDHWDRMGLTVRGLRGGVGRWVARAAAAAVPNRAGPPRRHPLLQYPIFYSAGMTARANAYYNLLTGWAAERVKGAAAAGGRPFAFARMAPFTRDMADAPGPLVLFATPGMLHGGQSLEMFKR